MIVYLIFCNNIEFNDCYFGGMVFSTKEKAENFLESNKYIWDTNYEKWISTEGAIIEAEIMEREVL